MFVIFDKYRDYVGEAQTLEVAQGFVLRWMEDNPEFGPFNIYECELVSTINDYQSKSMN